MANREFLLKAHTQKNNKYDVRGWYASEKLDGVRCFWDGGISRGLLKSQIPWANNKDKDLRFVVPPRASGLWSSLGNPIFAPDWFLDRLPATPMDGELWAGRRNFQRTTSIVSKIVPCDDEWTSISFNVFETPPLPMVFETGRINNPNFQKDMDLNECMDFVRRSIPGYRPRFYDFATVIDILSKMEQNESFRVVPQRLVNTSEDINNYINEVAELQGEGVMFRKPNSYWQPKRSHQLVKQKPYSDAEGVVTGYTWGKETDKGSKLLGMMGNLILDYKGKRLELSGFTDSERKMTFMPFPDGRSQSEINFAAQEGEFFPGSEVSRDWHSQQFRIGMTITFRYRELSDDGIPKESRYDRIRFGASLG
jgi:DNA ligase-1